MDNSLTIKGKDLQVMT